MASEGLRIALDAHGIKTFEQLKEFNLDGTIGGEMFGCARRLEGIERIATESLLNMRYELALLGRVTKHEAMLEAAQCLSELYEARERRDDTEPEDTTIH